MNSLSYALLYIPRIQALCIGKYSPYKLHTRQLALFFPLLAVRSNTPLLSIV